MKMMRMVILKMMVNIEIQMMIITIIIDGHCDDDPVYN